MFYNNIYVLKTQIYENIRFIHRHNISAEVFALQVTGKAAGSDPGKKIPAEILACAFADIVC